MSAGYWSSNYWPVSYWHPHYWIISGISALLNGLVRVVLVAARAYVECVAHVPSVVTTATRPYIGWSANNGY
jgi:hypothetical protein